MRKILFCVLLVTTFLSYFEICSAGKWKDDYEWASKNYIVSNYDRFYYSKSGIKVEWLGACLDPYFDHGIPKEKVYGDKKRAVALTGFTVEITNPTDELVFIEWKNSAVTLDGDSIGVPFLNGIKYKDAGNPNALTNDVIAPHSSIKKGMYLPRVHIRKGDVEYSSRWVHDGAILFKGVFRKLDYYICISKTDGTKEVLHINTPGIMLP